MGRIGRWRTGKGATVPVGGAGADIDEGEAPGGRVGDGQWGGSNGGSLLAVVTTLVVLLPPPCVRRLANDSEATEVVGGA